MKMIDYMIIGAEKAGTTSLYNYMAKHPQLCTHEEMEMRFFSRDEEYAAGYQQAYEKYFGDPSAGDRRHLFAKNAGCMYYTRAIDRLYDHNPKMKLVILLRDPVRRAYSAYWYSRQMGREKYRTFEAAIAAESGRIESGDIKAIRYNAYVTRGRYSEYLRHAYEVFPHEQITLVLFEDLKKFPKQTCDHLFGFFGLDQYDADVSRIYNKGSGGVRFPLLARFTSSGVTEKLLLGKFFPAGLKIAVKQKLRSLNRTTNRIDRPQIKKDTEKKLKRYYKAFNQELVCDYHLDITSWG